MFPYALASLDDMPVHDFKTLLQHLRRGHGIICEEGSFIGRLTDHMNSSKPDVKVEFLGGLRGRERLAAIATVRYIIDEEVKYDDTLHCGDIGSIRWKSWTWVEYNGTQMPFLTAMNWHQEHKLHLSKCLQALAGGG